jgi:hypothetical protein
LLIKGGKMKKKIIIESLLAVFMLIILPSIVAVEYNSSPIEPRTNLIEKIRELGSNGLLLSLPLMILQFILSWIFARLNVGDIWTSPFPVPF